MIEFPYLVALALIEQDGKRQMPLGGKSVKKLIQNNDLPGLLGEEISLEILTRVFQRSENGSLRRAAGSKSVLLIHIPITEMQRDLPSIKAEWISTGNTENLLQSLQRISNDIWTLNFVRYEGMQFDRIRIK